MLGNSWFKKEKPLLGLTGMGGGATGLSQAGVASTVLLGSYLADMTGTIRGTGWEWDNIFDGNKTTASAPGIGGNSLFTPSSSIAFATLAVYAYKDGTPGEIEINGTDVTSQIANHNGIGPNQRNVITGITSPLTSLKSISLANLSNVVISGIEINGKLLVEG